MGCSPIAVHRQNAAVNFQSECGEKLTLPTCNGLIATRLRTSSLDLKKNPVTGRLLVLSLAGNSIVPCCITDL